MAPKTQAERQAEVRQKRRAAGLMRVEVWIKPEHRQKLQAFVDKLRGKK